MLTPAILLLLMPAIWGAPGPKRQAETIQVPSDANGNRTSARVVIGGPENPIEIFGTVNSQLGLDQYYNIPFAAPPVGDLRFAPPQPAVYQGPINATVYGPACLQSIPDYAEAFGDLVGPYGMSEDCLQLNVFVPRDVVTIGTGMPVLVFVHGGGFFGGSANSVDGSLLVSAAARVGMPFIYVSVQYRVGILGFPLQNQFAQQGLTNLGLKDVKLALEWVQTNIGSFRGDPAKVTLAGQSAGAAITGLTHLWPEHNLYRSSIMMSGSPSLVIQNSTGLIDTVAGPVWDVLLASVNCRQKSDVVACLRACDIKTLSEVQNNLSDTFYSLYSPTVDGVYVPDSPYTLLASGAFRRVPYITGNTKDEGTAFAPRNVATDDEFRAYAGRQQLPPASDETIDMILRLYPDVPALGAPFDTGNETFGLGGQWKRVAAFATDQLYSAPRRHFASSMNNTGQKGWSYRWDETEVPNVPPELGAFHGSDMFFAAGVPYIPGLNYTEVQQALATNFITYIANFVHFSDPNGPTDLMNVTAGSDETMGPPEETALPLWPSYESGKILSMSSAEIIDITDDYRKDQIEFLNSNPDITNGY